MKRLQIVLFVSLAALAWGALHPVRGQGGDFTIENADATNTLSITGSSELEGLMDEVAPRFVMAFANANQYYNLTPIPAALDDLLDAMQPRFVTEFANAMRFYALTPIPSQLEMLLEQMAPRFVIEYANANRELALSFPVELIGDTTPPEGGGIEFEPEGETRTMVSWTTDEYADSTVACGTQSGNYTMTFSDPLYVRVHAVTLSGLTPGSRYYCRVSSSDLSGNTYRSQEFSFEQVEGSFIYLPLVLRWH
jgi:hypothetical protein